MYPKEPLWLVCLQPDKEGLLNFECLDWRQAGSVQAIKKLTIDPEMTADMNPLATHRNRLFFNLTYKEPIDGLDSYPKTLGDF